MSFQIKKHCQQLKKNYEVIKVRQFGHQTKKKQAHKHRTTNWLLPQGSRVELSKIVKEIKRHNLPFIKQISHRDQSTE